MKELVAKRQRAGRGRGEREKEREGGGWLAGWLVGRLVNERTEWTKREVGRGGGSLFSRQIKMLI